MPQNSDSRVKAMEIDERPAEGYGDLDGLKKYCWNFKRLFFCQWHEKKSSKSLEFVHRKVYSHGPPGSGKTLMARACTVETKATFLKLAGPQLVQMYTGEGAKMVADAFVLEKRSNQPSSSMMNWMHLAKKGAVERKKLMKCIELCWNFWTNSMYLLKTMISKSLQPL